MAANQAQSITRNQVNDALAYPYGVGLVTTGFPFGFDNFHGFNRFNRIRVQ